MKGEQQQINTAGNKLGSEAKTTQTNNMQETLKKISTKGISAKQAMGLTDEMVEGIYGQAYRLFNNGKYNDADQLFRLLLMINPTEGKYTMGLAACLHMQKDYKAAADVYAIVGIIDPQNPVPFYHAADCFMQLHDAMSAIIALEMAITRAGEKPEYRILKDRAALTLASLKKNAAETAK